MSDAARELEAPGATVDAVRVDLAREEDVEELWRRVTALHRPLAAAARHHGRGRRSAQIAAWSLSLAARHSCAYSQAST